MHHDRRFRYVLVVEPDVSADPGHFSDYVQNLGHQLHASASVCFLLHKNSRFKPTSPGVIKYALSHHSWAIGREDDAPNAEDRLTQFSNEILDAVDEFAESVDHDDPIMIYMYCGSIPHVKALLEVSIKRLNVYFCANLFYLPFQPFLTLAYRLKWESIMCAAKSSDRALITSPTREACDALRVAHGWYIDPTPHPCPSLSDASALHAIEQAKEELERRPVRPIRILFPGGSSHEKGLATTLETVKALSLGHAGKKYHITIRASTFESQHWQAIAGVRNRIEVLETSLSGDAFHDMIERAHIVVLPYTKEGFEYRTSGLLLEAIYRGKPCVVAANTWLGNLVERDACGIAVQYPDCASLIEGIDRAVDELRKLRKNAIKAAIRHYQSNRWSDLAGMITGEGHGRGMAGWRISGLASPLEKSPEMIVLGNGPSLRDFDFEFLRGFDVIGMNAAYRFWQRIGWYPRYYACLDTVVGLSHQSAIEELVSDSANNGIAIFFLRENLIRKSQVLSNSDKVINFDVARESSGILADPGITTGSHSALLGAYLGYRRIYLLGVDGAYVQEVEGTERVEARPDERSRHTLEIKKAPGHNPNYFFDDYQRVGDRYNIPNPGRGVHIDSWRVASVVMRAEGVKVLNANLKSKVDAFDFCRFDLVERGRTPPIIGREVVLGENRGAAPGSIASIGASRALRGPYAPSARARFVETGFIAKLMLQSGREGVMVDVGAHRGAAAQAFAAAGWQVIAHEPDPDNRAALEAWARERANVVVDPRALADASGKDLPLYASPESTGISSLLAFRDSHAAKCVVRTCTIADVVQERMLERIDVLKIDAEGYDLPILRAVPWDRLQPEVIVCEYEDRKTRALGYGVEDMARFLELKGYWVLVSEWHPIERYGGRHSWKRLCWYVPGQCDREGWGNLIAFRSPPAVPELLAAADDEIRVLTQPPKSRLASRNVSKEQSMNSRLRRLVKRLFRGNKVVRWVGLAAVPALAATTLVAAVLVLPAAEAALVIVVITFVAAVIGLPATVALTRKEARRRKRGDRQLRGALEASQKRVTTLERLLKQAHVAISEAEDRMVTRQRKAEDQIVARQRKALEPLIPGRAPHLAVFSRSPDAGVIAWLTETWAPKLGLGVDERELNYLAHRLRTIEANGIGRMATSIEAAMLRILSARAVRRDRLDVLEIGTLFGLGAAAVYEGARSRFEEVNLTLIDPLQGYYGDGRPDPLTGAIADREVLLYNLRQAGVRVEDVMIIQGQSEEEAVRTKAAERRYDLLIIDGDHSAEGVARDFEQYAPLVRESGFILFDDYDVPEWPAIKAFVDEQVADRPDLGFLGGEFRTAVLKVRSAVVPGLGKSAAVEASTAGPPRSKS